MIELNGKELSNKLYSLFDSNSIKGKLVVFSVGNDPASKIYVRNKQRACERVGIVFENIIVDENITPYEFSKLITNTLSNDVFSLDAAYAYEHYGMVLQLPAPEPLIEIFNAEVPPMFDVDGLGNTHFTNIMISGDSYHCSATPKGIITLLNNYNIDIEGKHVVIVGRSNIVGKPLAQMMLRKNATVTVCHSKTINLAEITKTADIIIVAIGKPKFITEDYVKDGAVVIDVGINKTEEGICGDVDFERVKDKCYAITPVPGGVGPMTVYSLIENVLNT